MAERVAILLTLKVDFLIIKIYNMKTKAIIILALAAVLVSLGAARITKAPVKKAELQATSSTTTAPIGGLGAEDR